MSQTSKHPGDTVGPNEARAFLLTVFLAIGSATALTADVPAPPGRPLFVYAGHALAVDFTNRSVSRVASFAPGAPTAAWGPNGRGRRVAAVSVPDRPYHFVVGPNGCAYVTHQTLTEKGFSLSVVDLPRERLRTTLDGVKGIRTDIDACNVGVFLATVGVRQHDYLLPRLYRIEEHGKALSLLAEGNAELALICRSAEERFRVVTIDPDLRTVLHDHPLPGPVHSVVSIDDSLMAYLDYPPFGGVEEQSLCFFDLGAGREVKRIPARQFLQGLE